MRYFDHAATSFPKAPGVAEAMARFVREDAANPGRAGHRMAVRAERMLDTLRLRLARLINAPSPERIVLTLNGTDALNIAIKGSLAPWLPPRGQASTADRPHVVTTVLEHNSVSRPLQALAGAGAIELTRVGCDDRGYVAADAMAKAITPATRLVLMTHASNVLGTVQPAAEVGQLCRDRGALFLLDAAQTAGVLPIDIDRMQIDMLAFPGHKGLLGPTGTGVLYVGPRCGLPADQQHRSEQQSGATPSPPFAAFREGGTGGDSSTPTQPTLMPYYLEAGTPNTIGAAGLLAAIDQLDQEIMANHHRHELELIRQLRDDLRQNPAITLHGDPAMRDTVGVLSLAIEGYDPADVANILDESFDIAVRAGLHCAPGAHRALGTAPAGSVRISPGPTTTAEDVAFLADALHQIAG